MKRTNIEHWEGWFSKVASDVVVLPYTFYANPDESKCLDPARNSVLEFLSILKLWTNWTIVSIFLNIVYYLY